MVTLEPFFRLQSRPPERERAGAPPVRRECSPGGADTSKREFVLQLHKLTRLAAGIAAAFVFAGSASAFTISDIRVEGLTRTEPGTVFSHLPFRTGEEYTAEKGVRAIHSLYQSGLFRDVSLSQEGDVVVVHVMERPAVGPGCPEARRLTA